MQPQPDLENIVKRSAKKAGDIFKQIVKENFPIFTDVEVKIEYKEKKGDQIWGACTNNKQIFIDIYDVDEIEKRFRKKILPHYKRVFKDIYGVSVPTEEALEYLMRDTFLFFLFHEIGHPKDCPNSKEEEKKIDKTLFETIKEVEPGIKTKDAIRKVDNVRNHVWDMVVNTLFYADTRGKRNPLDSEKFKQAYIDNGINIENYPDATIPIFYIDQCDTPGDKLFSLISLFYGSLHASNNQARHKHVKYFVKACEKTYMTKRDIRGVFTDMYKGFISELSDRELARVGINKRQYNSTAEKAFDYITANHVFEQEHDYLLESITKLLSNKRFRHKAIKGFVKPLVKYMSTAEKPSGPSEDDHGGGGCSSALDNLLEELSDEEKEDLLKEMANENYEMDSVSIEAADKFYRENKQTIDIKALSDRTKEETFEYTSQDFELIDTPIMSEEELLMNYDIDALRQFEVATDLPCLLNIDDGLWQVNIWEIKETKHSDPIITPADIALFDNVVFIVDSSGSMGVTKYVDSGSSYDIVCTSFYGLLDGLEKASDYSDRQIDVGLVNFSSSTKWSGFYDVKDVVKDHRNEFKKQLLTPEGGGSTLDCTVFDTIDEEKREGKNAYIILSDGGINEYDVYNKCEEITRDEDNILIYIDISPYANLNGGYTYESSLCKKLKKTGRDNIITRTVNSIDEITEELGNILVQEN